jgi:beta-lactamase superfamily II metal-dependent hydrolase
MGFEVDFLAVGEGEKSGDAICLRFGDPRGTRQEQTICVIDGGTKESGQNLVDHIRTYYCTDHVDYVFNTHPDMDHASGLCVVLEQLTCGALIMHRPWEHSEDICHLFDDPKITPERLAGRMERNILAARNLERLAHAKGIKIIEPFAGTSDNDKSIIVLGPDREYYQSLLANFRDMPELAQKSEMLKAIKQLIGDAITWVDETIGIETLSEPDEDAVSAENNSSSIILFQIDGHKLLFTGDAGTQALQRAVNFAKALGIDLTNLRFLQAPHHGSRRNVGPTILNQIKASSVYISAAKEGEPKHPSKRVTNALKRRGAHVYATQGKGLLYFSGFERSSWFPATEIPFYSRVEAD